VHVQVGNHGVRGLGDRLRVQGVVGLPSEVLQLDLQQICKELGCLGVSPAPTVLDPEDVLVPQAGPPGELGLAYSPALAPVLEGGERQAPAL